MPSTSFPPSHLSTVPTPVGTAAAAVNCPPAAVSVDHAAGGGDRLDPVQEGLVLTNRALVGHIVRDVLTRLPSHVDRGDLLSAGLVALTLAAGSWQENRGVPFARYAALRIRGAVTDELRSMDWASRGVRSRARTIADARTTLRSTLGRAATDGEVQTATRFSRAELDASAADIDRAGVLSLHTPTGAERAATLPSPAPDPAELLVEREAVGYLDDAIEELPERLRLVVRGYFFDQRPMAELAAELGVTDSRISQLRAEAVRLLRAGLHEPLHGAPEPTVVTFGPRGVAARHAYVAAVAARSSATARLRHTTALAETQPRPRPRPRLDTERAPALTLDDAS